MYLCYMKKNRTFKVGDKVALLNEPLTGTILRINSKIVVILTEDDFEYECMPHEIVLNSNLMELIEVALEDKNNSEKTVFSKAGHKAKTKTKSNPLEVDLHIHELVSSEKGMSNFEMLSIQLNTAKNKLDMAIKNRHQRIVFIHGVGEGKLKLELYKLFKKYPIEYYDASYQKYGYGATEVYIFQNKK